MTMLAVALVAQRSPRSRGRSEQRADTSGRAGDAAAQSNTFPGSGSLVKWLWVQAKGPFARRRSADFEAFGFRLLEVLKILGLEVLGFEVPYRFQGVF